MSEDHRFLEILRTVPKGQPAPNLILAAVHFLLLRGTQHELARYYPTLTEAPLRPEHAFPAFRAFCFEHEEAIRELLATRRVQTNEVRRCAYLFPAFVSIHQAMAQRPLAIIEIGTSAGLLLNFDRYAYDFGTGRIYGQLDSEVQITSEWRGPNRPRIPDSLPEIAERMGIDLQIVDLNGEQASQWLRSLVWPDQPERMKSLDAAIRQFESSPVTRLEGDAFDLLPSAFDPIPDEFLTCVFHCHTLNQFSEARRQDFAELLGRLSLRRPLVQLSAEWLYTPHPELRLVQWNAGQRSEMLLAKVDHHGRWIEWKHDGIDNRQGPAYGA
jgi:hypothetical protein